MSVIYNFNNTVKMAGNLYNVFVYGTLKKGEPNHKWFSKDDSGYFKFLCNAQTTEKYPLIIGTRYNIPFLLHSPGVGNHVHGEVYEVDEKVLANLDILEDHPNFYIREERVLKCLDGEQETIKAWIYFIKKFRSELLQKIMLDSYSTKGDHGLPYEIRYNRDPNYNYKTEILREESTVDDLNQI